MLRSIKSYVIRKGRLSERQGHALNHYAEGILIPEGIEPIEGNRLFSRDTPIILEIGFGMGASLTAMAKRFPEMDFIGIEVHQPGVGSLLADIHDESLTNIRIYQGDAVQFIESRVADNMLAGIQIFFPDPWPKKRHQKRRLIQTEFLTRLIPKLKEDGFIHAATDWEEYAHQILEVCSHHPELVNFSEENTFIERPETRPLTKFEKRGVALGHGVWDIKFRRSLIKAL